PSRRNPFPSRRTPGPRAIPDEDHAMTHPRLGLVLVLLWAQSSLAQEPPKKKYAKTYAQSFKGNALPAGWEFEGPRAEECVKFEPEGLRITLPTGFAGERPSTGLKSTFRVEGDFDIALNFEMLREPTKEEAGKVGSRLSIGIFKDTPKANVA